MQMTAYNSSWSSDCLYKSSSLCSSSCHPIFSISVRWKNTKWQDVACQLSNIYLQLPFQTKDKRCHQSHISAMNKKAVRQPKFMHMYMRVERCKRRKRVILTAAWFILINQLCFQSTSKLDLLIIMDLL